MLTVIFGSRKCVFGITRKVLDSEGDIFRTRAERPLSQPNLYVQYVLGLSPGVKRLGRGDIHLPPSRAWLVWTGAVPPSSLCACIVTSWIDLYLLH